MSFLSRSNDESSSASLPFVVCFVCFLGGGGGVCFSVQCFPQFTLTSVT